MAKRFFLRGGNGGEVGHGGVGGFGVFLILEELNFFYTEGMEGKSDTEG